MRYKGTLNWKYFLRNFYKVLMAGALLTVATDGLAVTESEMNQAEAITAKYYIRYMNNISDYLDSFTPSSMADLESQLKSDKDREYFKEFQKASVASDYSSWDKDKLVEYWSTTFLTSNSAHLDSKAANNGQARVRIKKSIQSMDVAEPEAAPQPEAALETEPPAPQTSTPSTTYTDPLEEYSVEAQIEENQEKMDALKDSLAAEEATAGQEKKSSGTWVYIMVLAILVVVVIVLVSYASRTMKNSKKNRYDDDDIPDNGRRGIPAAPTGNPVYTSGQSYAASTVEDARRRERYAENLASKTEEIMQLTRQLTDMEMLAAQLKEENRLLKIELERTRSKVTERHDSRPIETVAPVAAPVASAPMGGNKHEVYLGRVNSRGVFVRADRQPVEGQSIYKLTTTNGISGTFALISNPQLDRQLLSDPERWLSGGCFAHDLYDTNGRYSVLTETPGTAVFKDGAWRVERKAKIQYD